MDRIHDFDIRYLFFYKLPKAEFSLSIKLFVSVASGRPTPGI
ncbi:hypothetical protein D1BOALGB6SA_3315 [Olavius sp. associated proteobacterium Delta 1]|nr:hypothetical protein D1BOALGB6SA_3315 [Olavius sp. associated proteobacterium Delta 1]